jgi:hypothetical protein
MYPILPRLFLLLLLGVDWAADPSQVAPALEPLAAPLASTECFCHSTVYRDALLDECASAPVLALAVPDFCDITPAQAPAPRLPEWQPPAPGAGLVYVFMSLRR